MSGLLYQIPNEILCSLKKDSGSMILAIKASNRHPYLFTISFCNVKSLLIKITQMMLPLVDSPILVGSYLKPYWHNTLKFFQYCSRNLDSSGVSKPSNSRSIEYTAEAKGCLS